MKQKNMRGFTLIELMITVVIVGILASVAYPSYTEYVTKGRRAECKSALLQTSNLLERFYTVNNTYTVTVSDIGGKVDAATGTAFSGDSLASSACTITIAQLGTLGIANSFVVTGTPIKADAKCGNLTINSQGQKGKSGTESVAYCW